jgi:hypothetical protein
MTKNYFAFIDESGVLDESKNLQPFFAVGFLRILDTSIISEKLSQKHYDYFSVQKERRRKLLGELRDDPRLLDDKELNLLLVSTRHYEYKFTNVTFTTIDRYKEFIDAALKFPLHFCALVIDKTDPLFNSSIYKNYWHAYIKYTKILCQNNCEKGNKLCIIADYMNRPSVSDVCFEREINKLPNVFNTIRAHSETFTLLQLCDLFLGCVVFQWRQARGFVAKKSNRAKAKQEFVRYLISRLVIPPSKKSQYPLSKVITCHSPIYFSVWPLKLTDTKTGVSRILDSPSS